MRSRPARALVLLGLLLVLLSAAGLARPALAAPPGSDPDARPVIVPGREGEIQALFAPHELGGAVAEGWILHSFDIDVGTIVVWLEGPTPASGAKPGYARLTLDHPDYGPPGARQLTGFALAIPEQSAGSEDAVAAMVAAIEANDDGSFWGTNVVYAGEPREHPYDYALMRSRVFSTLELWFRDGLVLYLFIFACALGLALHKLRGAPRWIKLTLPGLVVLGVGLRVSLSPEVALAPWPYTRILVSAGKIFHGPGLALLHPERVWLSETILHSTLIYAALAPLAIYAHARYLLDDQRAAILAAAVVTVLPLHLRFSHSDAAFIPSITVSSVAFALVHAATRERSALGGWLAVALIGFPVALMYQVRPLNIMYFPLLLATAFVNQGVHSDKPPAQRARVVAAFLILGAVTFGLGVPKLLEGFGQQVDEGLSLRTLLQAGRVIFSVRWNALLNPMFTPPGLTLLAVFGAVDLWRRGRKLLFAFVVGWLMLFLVAHAYIIPGSPYMQARYHLHLVVPYMLLVACGAEAGLRWLKQAREREDNAGFIGRHAPWLRWGALAYLAASPLIHLHGIRHVDFNDAREWRFVHEQREQIPAACTIIEYSGIGADMRFRRVGTHIENGVEGQLWTVHEIRLPEGSEPTAALEPELPEEVRALLEDPPDCLYWYEGLPCFGNKPKQEHKAPICHAIEGFVELEEVASTQFESEPYDSNLAHGLGDTDHIELKLFRARARR